MYRKSVLMISATATLACTGCASSLTVAGSPTAGEQPFVGVPIARSVTVIERYALTEHKEGKQCTRITGEQLVQIPSGDFYYVNIDPSEFGTSSLALDLHENGTLDTLTLNSTPAPSEAANALATIAGEVLPVFGIGDGDSDGDGDSEARGEGGTPVVRPEVRPPCDTGKRLLCHVTLSGQAIGRACPVEGAS